MKLQHDVTFDSLNAVREEIREWFGPDGQSRAGLRAKSTTRDILLSVIIHSLADELSDTAAKEKIQAALESLHQKGERAG